MESTLTPEQKNQIASWVGQRDRILLEIGEKKTESEHLTVKNKDLASSNTDMADRIQQSIGRLEELAQKESDLSHLTTTENAGLSAEKSVLQTEITALHKEIDLLTEQKRTLVDSLIALSLAHEKVFAHAGHIEEQVGSIAKVSSENAQKIEAVLSLVEEKSKKIIELSTANIEGHTRVLGEIPRLFVELKRQSLDRDIISKHKTHE